MIEPLVYLVAGEDKDRYCLDPLKSALKEHFRQIKEIDTRTIFNEPEKLRELCEARWPILIYSSHIYGRRMSMIRGERRFISIGIEHGIAPYKRYTFGDHLIQSDIYFAPTKLWADRLIRLHAPPLGAVRLGGYPRLSSLKRKLDEFRQREASAPSRFWTNAAPGTRKLVIFSWHLIPQQLPALADRSEIVYLLHPSDAHLLNEISLSHATAVVSNPDTTTELLAMADTVYGDFSSMTMESAALGLPTYFFIVRAFYKSNCDMDESFFDPSSPNFAAIPHSDFRFPANEVCDLATLRALLHESGEAATMQVRPLAFESNLLPPDSLCDGNYIAGSVRSYYDHLLDNRLLDDAPAGSRSNLEAVDFVVNAYKKILMRPPDPEGFFSHLSKVIDDSDSRALNSAAVLNNIIRSQEGRDKWRGRADIPWL